MTDAAHAFEEMRRRRSRLPADEARRHYIRLGEDVLLEQIRADAEALDAGDEETGVPLGPFTRLEAGAVAARVGKSRGAITNLFGSQAAFQFASMTITARDFEDMGGVREVAYPAPAAFADAESWLAAFAGVEHARGPRHGTSPAPGYAARWTLWLSLLPYGVSSARIAEPSVAEFENWARWIERELLVPALEHFELEVAPPFRHADLALAIANLVEGLWLSQCLLAEYALEDGVPTETAARHALLMLWRGATRPRGA